MVLETTKEQIVLNQIIGQKKEIRTVEADIIVNDIKPDVLNIISGSPTFIWEKTKSYAGITREKYRQYFKGCKMAFAYCLDAPVLFNPSKSLSEFGIHYSPQSYIYISNL